MWLVLSAFIATLFQTISFEEPIVIRKHGVGQVSLGASAQSVYEAFRGKNRLVDLALEGHLSPALELTFPKSQGEGFVESYRDHRRAHSLRGWSLWQDRESIPPKSASGPFGWYVSMALSTRR
ncbi:MAG TPA: hypothetical protein VNJ03_05880, partial [Vicinamibacterales bacterium]|nr:hypothetical protein [Vicinamibacterales bacterium]